MNRTTLSIEKDKFLINNKLTYSEIPACKYQGLLMNTRFVQGIFEDKLDPKRFDRFGRNFHAEQNTRDLIASLPKWYAAGVRGITVGLQGGGACFTIDGNTIQNNPFSSDGKSLDHSYMNRMESIINAADEIGMVVIVSYFYWSQTRFFKGEEEIQNAVVTASTWLKEKGYKNVIIEIANEHNMEGYMKHKILHQAAGIVTLIHLAKEASGGIPVGCSGTGGYFSEDIAEASDVIMIHGNELTRNQLYNMIKRAKAIKPMRPIVINEDSQAISQMEVAIKNGVSWGYYNNMTKQEPPVDWRITKGEDQFFTLRLKEYIKNEAPKLPLEDQFYLQGLEPNMEYEGKRFIRLASLYPEKINYVEFYRNDELYEIAYDDPFCINFIWNWIQGPVEGVKQGEEWKAIVCLSDGRRIEKSLVV